MKKLLFVFALCLMAFTAMPVSAEEASSSDFANTPPELYTTVIVPTIPASTVTLPTTDAPAKIIDTSKKVTYLITRGKNLINVRLNSLKALKNRISASKLTDDQKAALNTKIDSETGKLTALLGQIQAGTDLETVRTQVKSIYSDYRIYAVFIPQINSLRALYALSEYADTLINDTSVKIQARIDAAKAKGKDVAAKQAALDDAKTKVAALKVSIQSLIDSVSALTPADYPTNSKTVLASIRTGIKDIRNQFNALYKAIRNARITVPRTTVKK